MDKLRRHKSMFSKSCLFLLMQLSQFPSRHFFRSRPPSFPRLCSSRERRKQTVAILPNAFRSLRYLRSHLLRDLEEERGTFLEHNTSKQHQVLWWLLVWLVVWRFISYVTLKVHHGIRQVIQERRILVASRGPGNARLDRILGSPKIRNKSAYMLPHLGPALKYKIKAFFCSGISLLIKQRGRKVDWNV